MSSSTPYIVEDEDLFSGDNNNNNNNNSTIPDDTVVSLPRKTGKIKDYTSLNFFAFLFACFSTISFAVFCTATQTYFITDVLGISEKLGSYIGTLGFYDELLAIVLVPFIGTLCDKIGSRPIQCCGAVIIGLSLYGFATFARSVYPGMLFWRLVFSLGVASSTSTMTVMLIELNNSNFKVAQLKRLFSRSTVQYDQDDLDVNPLLVSNAGDAQTTAEETPVTQEEVNEINKHKREGKRASMMGIASGLGAIFAVGFYLRLPVRFGESNPASTAMKDSYYTVGTIAIVSGVVLFLTLYKDDTKKMFRDDIDELFDGLQEDEEEEGGEGLVAGNGSAFGFNNKESYIDTLKTGVNLSIKNPVVLMSYAGSFMARVTTITVSIFIPFYINNYYFKSGKCSTHESDKLHCRESYILASILTGVSQTVALLAAPFWGILVDRANNHAHLLIMNNTLCAISAFGLSFITRPDESGLIYLWVSILGFTQIGYIIVSMTLLSNINGKERYYKYKGSISGVYSLFGGIGILIMNKIGGLFGDWLISGPFIMLLIFNLVFLAFMFALKGAKENDDRSIDDVVTRLRGMLMRRP